tara:strand:- start:1767 stop:1907 length:141 start_codon:yes stop_codon:yes gene_type:complete
MCDDYTEKEKKLMKVLYPKKYEELYPEVKEPEPEPETKKEEEPAAE